MKTKRNRPPYLFMATLVLPSLMIGYMAGAMTLTTQAPAQPIVQCTHQLEQQVEATEKPEETEKPEGADVEAVNLGTFKLTAYCACERCCGQWADGITYTGTTATAGRTIAVDPEVIPLGSTVLIDGHAYIAEDIGGAIDGNRIDVFFDSHSEALDFGVRSASVHLLQY